MPKRRGSRSGMSAVAVSMWSRNSRKITKYPRTIRSVWRLTCRRPPTGRFRRSISCLRPRKKKSSRFRDRLMSNAAAPAPEGSDRTDAPLHVAIIMDGNGRWAAARGLPRAEGHRRGVEALRRVVRAANELGILYLTIFSFSSENWSRPATEIGDLFGLLRRFIRNDLAPLHRDGVRVRVIGQREGVEPDISALLNEAEELTRPGQFFGFV